MPSKFSDKWDELYFLKYDADKTIDNTGDAYASFFDHVKDDHKFTNGNGGGGWTSVDDVLGAFSKVTISDKLFIISHGSTNGEIGEGKGHDTLARDLKNWGLKNVGLITFKCCNLGIGGFLEMFVSACTQRKITVGWVKGYKGISWTVWGISGAPHELVTSGILPKFGDSRVKIVTGNHPTPMEKFERYKY